jgi:hypothetical protein
MLFILLLLGALSGCVENYVYHPKREIKFTPTDKELSYEWVNLISKDGVKISGWWVPASQPRGVVLFCHGNGGNISYLLDTAVIFNRLGLSSLIFDYRGYGRSEGHPSEQGTYLDAEAAWNYLVEIRKISPKDIIIFGRSLGGSIAAWLACEHRPGALVVESSFTSITDVARERFHWLPLMFVKNYRYETLHYLEEVNCPVLIIHSRNDEIVPFHHGQKLFEKAGEPKIFVEIEGSHNKGFLLCLPRYEASLDAFISKYSGVKE